MVLVMASVSNPKARLSYTDRYPFLARLVVFVKDSEIHGIKRVINFQTSLIRSLVWLCMFLGSFSFLVYYYIERVTHFSDNPKATASLVQTDNMPLPALTIFNTNELRLYALTQRDVQLIGRQHFGIINKTHFEVGAEELLGPERARHLRAVLGDVETLEDTAYNITEIITRTGHQKEDMIVSCHWYDGINPAGPCDNVTHISHGFVYPFGNSYTLNIENKMRLLSSGYQAHLQLTLDTEVRQVNPLKRRGGRVKRNNRLGLFLAVHEPGKNPATMTNEVTFRYLELNKTNTYEIDLKRVMTYDFLGQPFGHCVRENPLAYYHYYSRASCMYECVMNRTIQQRGCTLYDMPYSEHAHCTDYLFNYSTYAVLRSNIEPCAHCDKPCKSWDYEYEVSVGVRDEGLPEGHIQVTMRGNDRLLFEQVEEIDLFPIGDLVAEIGGMASLFLGASILAVSHFFEFLLNEVVRWLRGAWHMVGPRNKVTHVHVAQAVAQAHTVAQAPPLAPATHR